MIINEFNIQYSIDELIECWPEFAKELFKQEDAILFKCLDEAKEKEQNEKNT